MPTPSIPIRRAFTSKVILRGWSGGESRWIRSPGPGQIGGGKGFPTWLSLSSHLIPGEEYDKLRALIEEYRPRFPSLSLTAPLLHTTGICWQWPRRS